MSEDSAFLRAILADPRDDGLRLVYADWLDEHGGPAAEAKAEFLRLTAQRADKKRKKAREKRLQELAAGLGTDWLAVVSRLAIENCQGKQPEADESYIVRFDYLCDRRWEDLRTTSDGAVRFCNACRHNVHYCDTITDARQHAHKGHCVAVDLGVIRRERDLQPPLMFMGMMSPEALRRERELMQPDPVSVERERRKKGAGPHQTKEHS